MSLDSRVKEFLTFMQEKHMCPPNLKKLYMEGKMDWLEGELQMLVYDLEQDKKYSLVRKLRGLMEEMGMNWRIDEMMYSRIKEDIEERMGDEWREMNEIPQNDGEHWDVSEDENNNEGVNESQTRKLFSEIQEFSDENLMELYKQRKFDDLRFELRHICIDLEDRGNLCGSLLTNLDRWMRDMRMTR